MAARSQSIPESAAGVRLPPANRTRRTGSEALRFRAVSLRPPGYRAPLPPGIPAVRLRPMLDKKHPTMNLNGRLIMNETTRLTACSVIATVCYRLRVQQSRTQTSSHESSDSDMAAWLHATATWACRDCSSLYTATLAEQLNPMIGALCSNRMCRTGAHQPISAQQTKRIPA